MPPFLYTVIFVTGVLWFVTARFVTKVPPDNYENIIKFFVLAFVTFTLTFSVPIYAFFVRRSARFTKLREIYRQSAKWGAFFSFGIVGFLALKAFHLLNLLNGGLFALLYFLVFLWFRSSHRE